ncbi:hypothetical protein KJ708_14140 [bacterium]|nr:hypothetical protein [bacterium]MBU1916627.1 hypothetical protein [bacterium]
MSFNKSYIILFFLCLTSLLINCGSTTSSGTDSDSDSGLELTFSTTTSSSSSLNFAPGISATVTPMDNCREAGENAGGAETQQCRATPVGYGLGVLAIYLNDCKDATGASVICTSEDLDSIERVTLYEGNQIDFEITTTKSDFTGKLEALTSSATAGGLQIVSSYIQQSFPSASDPDADTVMTDLQGVTYRICIAPDTELDAETMEKRCGHEEAIKGDYLIDLDGDGVFGFIGGVTAEDTVTEESSRPADYSDYNDEHFVNENVCFASGGGAGSCENEYTDGVFYAVEGYFAPILPFTELQTFSPSIDYEVNSVFDITDTFEWTDGADGPIATNNPCVGAISDQCEEGSEDDDDPNTAGSFDLFVDTAFLPTTPSVTVSVTE